MNPRIFLIIFGFLLHPAVLLLAQQDVLRFQNVSVADALTTINEHYPDNNVHFVRNELDTLLVPNITVKGQDILEDITRLISGYPIGIKIFGNHIFVEYQHQKLTFGNYPKLIKDDDDNIAFSRILHEVMVKEEFPILDYDGSVTSFRISGTPLSVAGSAYDLLYYIPGFQIGATGAVIRIDGKTVTSYSELTELDSGDVDRIDYSDQPQFSSRRSIIIDIRTNRKRENGYGIHTASQYSQGERGRAMQLVKTNLHQDRMDLQASGCYRYDGIDKDLSVNQCTFQDRYEQNSFHLYLGGEYRLSNKSSIGLQYQNYAMLNIIRQNRDNLIFDFDYHNIKWANNEANLKTMMSINEWQLDYQPMHNMNLYYVSAFDKWSLNMVASFYHDGVRISEDNRIESVFHDKRFNEVQNTLWAMKADAHRPLWNGRLHVMTEYAYTSREDFYQRGDSASSNLLRKQKRWSGSISYRRRLGWTEGTLGVLLEAIDAASDIKKAYPFANLSFIGEKQKLSFSYAMRSSMPTYDQTNGFTYHNIEMLGVEGEPNLRPSINHHLQLKYQKGNFYGVIGWQHVSDFIAHSVESKNNEFFANYKNIDSAKLFSATINYHYSLRNWRAQVISTLRGQQIEFDGQSYNNPILEFKWNNQVQFPYSIIAMLNVSCQTSGNDGVTWQKHSGQVDFSLTKETKNWTLQLNVDDLFRTGVTRIIYYGNESEYSRRCYTDNQRIQLTFRINLGTLSRHTLRSLRAGESERVRM
jgi:hypothetical protein